MALPVYNLQALLFWSFKEVGGRRRKINYIPQICHLQDRVKQVYHQQVVMLATKGKMDNYQSYTCTHILIVQFLYSFTFFYVLFYCRLMLKSAANISVRNLRSILHDTKVKPNTCETWKWRLTEFEESHNIYCAKCVALYPRRQEAAIVPTSPLATCLLTRILAAC